MQIERYTVEWIHRGEQSKPYADHVWEFLITAERQSAEGMEPFPESWAPIVKQAAQGFCHWEENGGNFSHHLRTFEHTPDGRWRVVVNEPFTD